MKVQTAPPGNAMPLPDLVQVLTCAWRQQEPTHLPAAAQEPAHLPAAVHFARAVLMCVCSVS